MYILSIRRCFTARLTSGAGLMGTKTWKPLLISIGCLIFLNLLSALHSMTSVGNSFISSIGLFAYYFAAHFQDGFFTILGNNGSYAWL